MQRTKDEAFAKAVEWQSVSPVRSWVLAWARDVEIARRPGLTARHARARSNLEHEDAAVAREALHDPRGGDVVVPGGMFTYQIVVRSERVYVVQLTYLG